MVSWTSTELILPNTRQRKRLQRKIEQSVDFIWNKRSNEFLGRNPLSWGMLILYYAIFYVALLGIFGVLLAFVVYVCIDANYPNLEKYDNLLKYQPGMSFRPQPISDSTLIRFVQGNPSSYKIYTDHIQAFIEQYENEKQVGENFVDCERGEKSQEDKICRFDVTNLGGECSWQKDYGFEEGQPCILLKLNRLFGWKPEMYDSYDESPIDVQKSVGSALNWKNKKNHIIVTCDGETPSDRENIGNLTFFPSNGFPSVYYPYLNQEGYRQPVVVVRFENAANGILIQVWCKAWAKNIMHHRYDRIGSIHFELLMD